MEILAVDCAANRLSLVSMNQKNIIWTTVLMSLLSANLGVNVSLNLDIDIDTDINTDAVPNFDLGINNESCVTQLSASTDNDAINLFSRLPWLLVVFFLINLICGFAWIVCKHLRSVGLSNDADEIDSVDANEVKHAWPQGGGRPHAYDPELIIPHATSPLSQKLTKCKGYMLKYVDHFDGGEDIRYQSDIEYIRAKVPLKLLAPYAPLSSLWKVAKIHNISLSRCARKSRSEICQIFENHRCERCNESYSVFSVKWHTSTKSSEEEAPKPEANIFPPPPLTNRLAHRIIQDFCEAMSPENLEEGGCSICGKLTPLKDLSPIRHIKQILHVLTVPGITRIERKKSTEPVKEVEGPVIDPNCKDVCKDCRKTLRVGKIPRYALASGLWIGDVPGVLQDLTWVEQMLIAKVRHNACFVRVASGHKKMIAHVVAFQSPIQKIYTALPPPITELDEVLAIMFTGPCAPTDEDYKNRLKPLLVRRRKVCDALEWLKLNHVDYQDLEIAYRNLEDYPENSPPVAIQFKEMQTNKLPESMSQFDMETEDGVDSGDIPFVVHSLTGENIGAKAGRVLKGIALQHWNRGGKVLMIGREEGLESIYNNPHLYPQMFPWLFPYGLGGIGSTKLSDTAHKRYLLMYHDKRFQRDPIFPFAAFSHEQKKACSSGGYLLTERKDFDNIATRFLEVDQNLLSLLAQKMANGEIVRPVTEEEKVCYKLISDIDCIGSHVPGLISSKKVQRNELWALSAYKGAPMWYITLSPPDSRHPIALYFAGTGETFHLPSMDENERLKTIASNPVAAARFFHFMVNQFITHILGIGTTHDGLFGKTSAYYGTVEQQGRLTLHLHLLLWIEGSCSPDEMRKKILDSTSDFQQRLIDYLESVHVGEFMTGTKEEVLSRINNAKKSGEFDDPTLKLPSRPPEYCKACCGECSLCQKVDEWWENHFKPKVDEIVGLSNVHACYSTKKANGSQDKRYNHVGCLDNKYGTCKARFPRPTYEKTTIDWATGAFFLKKLESMINTIAPVITYLFGCNTDVTSLRSGTALKGVLSYCADYITKPGLKTWAIFEAIRSVLQKNVELIGSTIPRQEKVRKLMTKLVNEIGTKMELGSPMISMYLLGHPDHYTNYKFVPFYWQQFVEEATSAWKEDALNCTDRSAKIVIIKKNDRVIGLSNVYDYTLRSRELEDMDLYSWISRCTRQKKKNSTQMKSDITNRENDDKPDGLLCSDVELEEDEEEATIKKSSNLYEFTSEHPLATSHATQCVPESKVRIPNFLGGNLPRRDQGDREKYCATMLTLFKPWRTGRDLKQAGETWDEAFVAYPFTQREEQLMNNFMLRYECLDGRDDYHAQMRTKESNGVPGGLSTDDLKELDQLNANVDHSDEDMQVVDQIIDVSDTIGTRERKRRDEIKSIIQLMQRLQWEHPKKKTHLQNTRIFTSAVDRNAAEWRAIIISKRREILDNRSNPPSAGQPSAELDVAVLPNTISNKVQIVDKRYFEKTCKPPLWQSKIETIAKNYTLNAEQERAFSIVANHVALSESEQLKMYIGGMGGTGKSQVLKALINFFELRNEGHRFITVAPTGTAAALLGGSTYHYMFGINDHKPKSNSNLSQIKDRLFGVDYVFLDEVSMLSCHDLFKISERLSQVRNCSEPFGGIHFIFAGDFGQLPPALGGESTSLYSRTIGGTATTLLKQESALGKSYWHQVNTVVILRQNMRQRNQSAADAAYRKALENMRYKDCTQADLAFLRTRISSHAIGAPCILDDEFRDVSIITALNSHKDAINMLGTSRFSSETEQELQHFYSEDILYCQSDQQKPSARGSRKKKTIELTDDIQHMLWNAPHCSTSNHIPGKLSLCVGMPIMIRQNGATELGITKGQEAVVLGWKTETGSRGQLMLETLFVELINPPRPVQIDGLPENVVPLTRSNNTVRCSLSDDSILDISRSQVEVLPNFAMTDFASQGRTRPRNPVHLNNCRSHHSYYTALSRSSTAAGTVILQGFDHHKITGGASGALRQEFRSLEVLDYITKLRFESNLPDKVSGTYRHELISSFRQWKGDDFVPPTVHKAIKWMKKDPFVPDTILEFDSSKPKEFITKQQVGPTKMSPSHVLAQPNNLKRKFSSDGPSVEPPKKKSKIQIHENCLKRKRSNSSTSTESTQGLSYFSSSQASTNSFSQTSASDFEEGPPHKKLKSVEDESMITQYEFVNIIPLGLIWKDNSCAFDSVLTVLYNIWNECPILRSAQFSTTNIDRQFHLTTGFRQVSDKTASFEAIRENLRNTLDSFQTGQFIYGQEISVQTLLLLLLEPVSPFLSTRWMCSRGHPVRRTQVTSSDCLMTVVDDYANIQDFLDDVESQETRRLCVLCSNTLTKHITFISTPKVLAFDLSDHQPDLSEIVMLPTNQGVAKYRLKGTIYYGSGHFTSRLITQGNTVWYHDGLYTRQTLIFEGHLSSVQLSKKGDKTITAAIYVLIE